MEFQLFCFLFEKNKSISKVKAHLQAVWSECCFPLKYCWVFVYCQTSAHPPKLEFSFLGNSKNSLNIGCFNRNKKHQVIVQLQDGVQNTTIVSYNNVLFLQLPLILIFIIPQSLFLTLLFTFVIYQEIQLWM